MLINYGLLSHYESLACRRPLPRHYRGPSCTQSLSESAGEERQAASLSGLPITGRGPGHVRPRRAAAAEPDRVRPSQTETDWDRDGPSQTGTKSDRLGPGPSQTESGRDHPPAGHRRPADSEPAPINIVLMTLVPPQRGASIYSRHCSRADQGGALSASGWSIYSANGAAESIGIGVLTDQRRLPPQLKSSSQVTAPSPRSFGTPSGNSVGPEAPPDWLAARSVRSYDIRLGRQVEAEEG